MEKETAVLNALRYARSKENEGLLVNTNDDNSEALMENLSTDEGDRETVFSIISLYSDDVNNDGTWEATIQEGLKQEFPNHF